MSSEPQNFYNPLQTAESTQHQTQQFQLGTERKQIWKIQEGDSKINLVKQDQSSVFSSRVKNVVHLEWNNIYASVSKKVGKPCKKTIKTVQIIKGVSGYAPPGKFVAIMGESGAGKTTILNILSNRQAYLKGLTIEGDVFVNGQDIKSVGFSSFAGYLMQFDILQVELTAREQLEFTSKFRLYHKTEAERQAIIESLVQDMMLSHCQHEQVGDDLNKKLSGGEKKRVSMAIELIPNPTLLFLDEVTTGLDSMNSVKVLTKVKELANIGHTIVATIHQPSSEIFDLFDQLILMDNGLIGDAKQAKQHFANIGYRLPSYTNPAEFYINLLSQNYHEESIRINNPQITDREAIEQAKKVYNEAFEKIQAAYVPNLCPEPKNIGSLISDEMKKQMNIFQTFWILYTVSNRSRFRSRQFFP